MTDVHLNDKKVKEHKKALKMDEKWPKDQRLNDSLFLAFALLETNASFLFVAIFCSFTRQLENFSLDESLALPLSTTISGLGGNYVRSRLSEKIQQLCSERERRNFRLDRFFTQKSSPGKKIAEQSIKASTRQFFKHWQAGISAINMVGKW